MIGIILFGLEILFLAAVSLGLLKLRTKYGLVPFYMFLAACLVYGEMTTSFALFTFMGFDVAGTAVAIFPLMLFALILIYDLRGIEETRRYIFGIILAVMLIIPLNCLFLYKSEYLLSPYSLFDFKLLHTILYPNLFIFAFSVLGFIISVFLIIVIYNFLTGICKYKFLCVFIPLTLGLYADSVVFVSGLYISGLTTAGMLPAHIFTKTFASLLYSSIYVIVSPFIIPEKNEQIIERPQKTVEIDELKTGFGGRVEEGFKVLVADDTPEVIELLKHTLKYENWEVVEAKNGKEALGMVFAEGPDIILLDIMMPEMDGYQVVEILRSHRTTKDIPIIMLTAKGGKEEKLKGMEIGIDDYITKPFLPEELVARIKMVMRRSVK